jgi:hypothetical protein
MSTEEDDKKLPSGDDQDDDDDEEDVEQLQAEIARMEAEANRIAKETEELENKKGGSAATKASGGAGASSGEAPNRDGCVRIIGMGEFIDDKSSPVNLSCFSWSFLQSLYLCRTSRLFSDSRGVVVPF